MSNIITVKNMCLWYGEHKALTDINIDVPEKSITALIGPSAVSYTHLTVPANITEKAVSATGEENV